jgi:hypothetical protein
LILGLDRLESSEYNPGPVVIVIFGTKYRPEDDEYTLGRVVFGRFGLSFA